MAIVKPVNVAGRWEAFKARFQSCESSLMRSSYLFLLKIDASMTAISPCRPSG